MQMVKIHIPERGDRAKAMETLTLRGRIICLPDNIFIVPEPALEVLQSLAVTYQELRAPEDSTMRKRRYEILLPVRFNDGRPVSGELLEETREELVTQFRALQIQPHTVLGLWIYEGARFEDELRRFTVDVEDTPENQQFFVEFKQKLLARFEQLEIYVASYPVDIL